MDGWIDDIYEVIKNASTYWIFNSIKGLLTFSRCDNGTVDIFL